MYVIVWGIRIHHENLELMENIVDLINLNVKNLFGTSENSVYNQLFIALITYVLIKSAYDEISKKLRCVKLSFNQFIRKLINSTLQDEVQVSIDLFLKNIN